MSNVAEAVQQGKAHVAATETITVHGGEIDVVRDEDGVWVSVRRVCEALGLDRKAQQEKLQARPWATGGMKPLIGSDSKSREHYCLHLDALPMWLATIEASRVRAELRPRLELYQREAARVLREHFFGPVKPREPGDLPPAPPRSPYQDLRFVNIDGWRFLVDRSGVRVCAYDLARKLGWLSPNDLADHRLQDMASAGQAAAHEVSTGYLFEATALGLAERTMTRPEDVRTVNTMKGHFAFLRHASEPVAQRSTPRRRWPSSSGWRCPACAGSPSRSSCTTCRACSSSSSPCVSSRKTSWSTCLGSWARSSPWRGGASKDSATRSRATLPSEPPKPPRPASPFSRRRNRDAATGESDNPPLTA